MKVLLSIKPVFASRIFNGQKEFEYRKNIFKADDIEKVIVYASSPVKRIIGEFEIKCIHHNDIDLLWNNTKEKSGVSEEIFYSYFQNHQKGYAIEIHNVNEYEDPLRLEETYGISPPQSFAYVS